MANSMDQVWSDVVEEEEDEDDNDEIEYVEDERKKRAVGSSSSSSRGGSGGGGGRTPTVARCQADSCNADLSRAKAYHRRHKVCEFHAKAAVAILAGLEQRFCQQCSRFHSVTEFDDTKRSCRMRLAGHNERRRKTLPEFQGHPSLDQ